MVTAGLCHDIDHRGTNNLYQMKYVLIKVNVPLLLPMKNVEALQYSEMKCGGILILDHQHSLLGVSCTIFFERATVIHMTKKNTFC